MKSAKKSIRKEVLSALLEKKEVKNRFQNGENLKKLAKEKGFVIIQPL